MVMKFTNNATTTLASNITSSATSLTVSASSGSLFPTLGGSDYFYCTLANTSGAIEIVKVTARSTDTFTITRGQDGTTGQAWNSGDKVELRLVAASLNDLPKLDEANTFTGANAYGTPASITLTNGTGLSLTAGVTGTLPVANGGTGVTTSTGSGANVLGTSPTITTPTINSLSSASATALTLQSAGTTAITVDTSQNVGIGTSSPATKLEVASPAATPVVLRLASNKTGTGAGDKGRLDFYSADNSGTAYQLGYMDVDRSDGTGTASYISFANRVSGTVAERMRINSAGLLQFNSGYGSVATAYGCRAWATFNTVAVTITASGNVSSVTNFGTGDNSIAFTTAMVDANYSIVGSTIKGAGGPSASNSGWVTMGEGPSTTATGVGTLNGSGSVVNRTYVYVAVFR